MDVNYWEHRKPAQRTRTITEQDIARAAAALLDAGGLRALTVRAAAKELGVAAPSLYSRIESVDDLFDLALDEMLGTDPGVTAALEDTSVQALMLAFYHHLARHRWACQVIGMRAPRGPNYLRLSERMCVLLDDAGVADPLGSAYALSNFVIGSANASPMVDNERTATVDSGIAPTYSRLHSEHSVNAEAIVIAGLAALSAQAAEP